MKNLFWKQCIRSLLNKMLMKYIWWILLIFKENIDNNLESIGSGNKTFVVYKNSMNTVELVKYGWSWFAFLFSGLWLVYKGLYIKAVEIFVFSTLILSLSIETILAKSKIFGLVWILLIILYQFLSGIFSKTPLYPCLLS